jgi:hypothetical protein
MVSALFVWMLVASMAAYNIAGTVSILIVLFILTFAAAIRLSKDIKY